MRASVAALLLLSASTFQLAAHADTVDVMTVTGNSHTWIFDFPAIQTFTYPINLPLFVPGLTPLSASLDGASIAPTAIFFHNFQNLSGPFGQIITPGAGLLDVLSMSGPFTDPVTHQIYYAYTSTLFTGTFFGTEVVSGPNGPSVVPFTVNVDAQQTTAPTPEPSSLLLLATALAAVAATALPAVATSFWVAQPFRVGSHRPGAGCPVHRGTR